MNLKILKKKVIYKFQLIPTLSLQVMPDYVHCHFSLDCCVRMSDFYVKITLISLLNFFEEMCFLEESYEKMKKNQILTIFESAIYVKSRSMPLIYVGYRRFG